MIVAGEASGDLHGAALIRELKKVEPDLNIFGIGGDKMIDAGMTPEFHIKDMAFLGFAEVVKHLPFIKKVKNRLIEIIVKNQIKSVVLIDYPGFNLNLAKKIKKMGVEITYYISPQIWAWGQGRIKKIKKLVNKMLVVFPFEKDFYAAANVNVEHVGHPLIERIDEYNFLSRDELNKKYGLDEKKEILLVMPGSRKQEIERIFPSVITAAEKISSDFNMQTVVACSENIDEELLRSVSDNSAYKLVKGNTYDLLKCAKFGIIKSGTSTLEAALFKLPSIVVYSTSKLTYMIGKAVVKIDHISMANIIAGETVYPELIQDDVNPENIYQHVKSIVTDSDNYKSVQNKLEKIKNILGEPGASKKASEFILKSLNEA